MKRSLGLLSLGSAVLTTIWLALLIVEMAGAGPLDTFEQVIAHARQAVGLRMISYLNAAMITLAVTMFFAALYRRYSQAAPEWSLIGLVFIPVYCTLNLAVYLLQVTAVPALLVQAANPAAETLLRLLMQSYSGSAAAFFNNLAYALLGIPSIIFGILMRREGCLLAAAGILLALNGVACMVGVTGVLIGSRLFSLGSLAGGVLFLAALAVSSLVYLKEA